MDFEHNSVLLRETIESLMIKPDGIYVDGTLGGGGHALEICKRLNEKGKLIGIDQDSDAILAAKTRLSKYDDIVTIIHSNYVLIGDVLESLNIDKVDGILLDIGVSSYQIDSPDRGFSYMERASLDMRMDRGGELTAGDVVNTYSEDELTKLIRDYGEERYARSIARNIILARRQKEIETTVELTEIIKKAVPLKSYINKGHPAKRTFQAIRIEVNKELEVLETSIDKMIDLLKPGGRLCIITFHSLEDRIVKTGFKRNESPCECPPGFPVCVCKKTSKGRMVTKKPIVPAGDEIENNKRSKSSKLRVFERN